MVVGWAKARSAVPTGARGAKATLFVDPLKLFVGWAKARSAVPTRLSASSEVMTYYRRAHIEGGIFFFTVTLADRSSNLLVSEIDRLRSVYAAVKKKHQFETIAICVLPE